MAGALQHDEALPHCLDAETTSAFSCSTAPPHVSDDISDAGDGDDSDDIPVLFDFCRFPRLSNDLLESLLFEDQCQSPPPGPETGKPWRVVGEADDLKRLFQLPLRSSNESISVHRVGGSLVVLDTVDDPLALKGLAWMSSTAVLGSPRSASMRCTVQLDGDMARIFPRTAPAEPLNLNSQSAGDPREPARQESQPIACEWRVREGLSVLAVTTAKADPCDGQCTVVDLRNRKQEASDEKDLGLCIAPSESEVQRRSYRWPTPPPYHRQVSEALGEVLVVQISEVVDTASLVDAWLSCCLVGSPSVLCFFIDSHGACKGCEYVAVADLPSLASIVERYQPGKKCLTHASGHVESGNSCLGDDTRESAAGPTGERGAFDPRVLRARSHSLLDTLIEHCQVEGGQCLAIADPLGLRLMDIWQNCRAAVDGEAEAMEDDELDLVKDDIAGMDALSSDIRLLPAGFGQSSGKVPDVEAKDKLTSTSTLASSPLVLTQKMQRAHLTQGLLLYHAAVRLAQARHGSAVLGGGFKGVPSGSRWTAKSCRQPLQVRRMMLQSMRALQAALAAEKKAEQCEAGVVREPRADADGSLGERRADLPLHERLHLLFASVCEFLADTFLAEDSRPERDLECARYMSALSYLRRSVKHIEDYHASSTLRADSEEDEDLVQSVQRLEERASAKLANAHLCLARLRQRQPWALARTASTVLEGEVAADVGDSPDSASSGLGLTCRAAALQELDAAEEQIMRPHKQQGLGVAAAATPGSASKPTRPLSPHECSLLASISKWKADLLFQLSQLAASNKTSRAEGQQEYLEAQQQEMRESGQPLPQQRERWLQSTVSLCLRSLRQLTSVPSEVTSDLQLQARALLARAYGELGRFYAVTGRYTKAMTHAKQGIELFTATKDALHAASLQLWLCRLQLRLALPQAAGPAPALPGEEILLHDHVLLRGASSMTAAEDSSCTQVVQAVRKVLQSLEALQEGDAAERTILSEGQMLLAHILLRQGMARLAKTKTFGPIAHLCEEGVAIASAMDLVQAKPVAGVQLDDATREAVELLLQSAAYFREATSGELTGMAHTCLAAVYFCGRLDPRAQRLASTHCQHALECLPHGSAAEEVPPAAATQKPDESQGRTRTLLHMLRLVVQLFEARMAKRTVSSGNGGVNSKGAPKASRHADIRAATFLCDVTLQSEALSSEEAASEQCKSLIAFVKQELGELLMRLLRSVERQDGTGRELKGLYCALVTAWHSDTRQVEALTALRDYLSGCQVEE